MTRTIPVFISSRKFPFGEYFSIRDCCGPMRRFSSCTSSYILFHRLTHKIFPLTRQSTTDRHDPISGLLASRPRTGEKGEGYEKKVQITSALPQSSKIFKLGTRSSKFTLLDEITSEEKLDQEDRSLLDVKDEQSWRYKLMFKYEFMKPPLHLSWMQLGREVECLECIIEPDNARPEEIYRLSFWYKNYETRTRSCIFTIENDVSQSEGFTDLLGAVGSCLSRAEVHRTLRFDNGKGEYREINLRKSSKYTSEILLAFRPSVQYDMYHRAEQRLALEQKKEKYFSTLNAPWLRSCESTEAPMQLKIESTRSNIPIPPPEVRPSDLDAGDVDTVTLLRKNVSPRAYRPRQKRGQGAVKPENSWFFKSEMKISVPDLDSTARNPESAGFFWGFHPSLMDPEYRDNEDPPGTYHMVLSAHALSSVLNRALERLVVRPLKDFYRPSQIASVATVGVDEDVGVLQAVRGWLGVESRRYPHYTPLEAIQANWLGDEAPFQLVAIVNRLRELTYLTRKNLESLSWWSVRMLDTSVAMRNLYAKSLGAGPSPLFLPSSFSPTINQMLPKTERRRILTNFSLAGVLGYRDETKYLPPETSRLASPNLLSSTSTSNRGSTRHRHSEGRKKVKLRKKPQRRRRKTSSRWDLGGKRLRGECVSKRGKRDFCP